MCAWKLVIQLTLSILNAFQAWIPGYVIECRVTLKITIDKEQACNTMFSFENNDIFNWKLGE